MVLPPSLQGSLPAGWLAFTGRESNPQDRYKRFQVAVSSSFSGFILAQGKFHSALPAFRATVGLPQSLRLDVGRPDHLAPLLSFVGNELSKVGGRTCEHRTS